MQVAVYLLIWGALIFFMMRFGCGAHVAGHGHAHTPDGSKSEAEAVAGGTARVISPARAVDPVCGMTIETAAAKSSVYDGHVHYFCSQNCREKFEAAPQTYISRAATPQMPAGVHHGAH